MFENFKKKLKKFAESEGDEIEFKINIPPLISNILDFFGIEPKDRNFNLDQYSYVIIILIITFISIIIYKFLI